MGVSRAGRLTAAVFLDRDGVINEPSWDPADGRYESPTDPRDVALADGAVEGLRALTAEGYVTVAVSNQPAAAKGKASLEDLKTVHERIVDLLAAAGLALDDWRYCFHHPDAVVPELRDACACRKPEPGLLLAAAQAHGIVLDASWMVGDSTTDVVAGRRAGCRTVLVEHPRSGHRRDKDVIADANVRNLAAAAAFMIQIDRARLSNR
jgi:D-glycero-D-manno-heptose 1,7-bisphosphate phosphatase